ncbi:hypothetical protein [Streptomyces tendae]|uniref:hypothetical protein n=1 Tax=Streptomyces tendae TaxID=1932 RepID=UPI0036B061F6
MQRERELFGRIEAVARAAGHASTLDAWGDDLGLIRPAALGLIRPAALGLMRPAAGWRVP